MNYYYFNNQVNNNQYHSQPNQYQQQGLYKQMRNPQMQQNQKFNNQAQYGSQGFNQGLNRNPNPNNQYYGNKGFQIPSETDEQSIIQSLKYVSEKYPHLITLNQENAGIPNKVRTQSSPRFFVIKSFTEEDIHKVLKSL